MSFLNRLPENIQHMLQKGNIISVQEILCLPDTSLQKLGLTTENIKLIRKEAAYSIDLSFISVKQLVDNPVKWKRLSFGCDSLDKCTNGGILTRGITEICGESSSGKTQIALQLSLAVQIPEICGGLNKGAIYVCAGKPFQSKRLFQLIEIFKEKYPYDIEYTKNIFVEHLKENEELLNCILVRVRNLMKNRDIGLIIIDSVAEIYRIETNYVERAKSMRKLANGLLHLIDKYQCAVICINQVTSDINCSHNVPSLGITWANLIRTRIKISRCDNTSSSSISSGHKINETKSQRRKFEILFTPDSNCESCEFLLTSRGIIDIQNG